MSSEDEGCSAGFHIFGSQHKLSPGKTPGVFPPAVEPCKADIDALRGALEVVSWAPILVPIARFLRPKEPTLDPQLQGYVFSPGRLALGLIRSLLCL